MKTIFAVERQFNINALNTRGPPLPQQRTEGDLFVFDSLNETSKNFSFAIKTINKTLFINISITSNQFEVKFIND